MEITDAAVRWAMGLMDLCERAAAAQEALSEDARDRGLRALLAGSAAQLAACARELRTFVSERGSLEVGARTAVGVLHGFWLSELASPGGGGDLAVAADARVAIGLARELAAGVLEEVTDRDLAAVAGVHLARIEALEAEIDMWDGPVRAPAELAAAHA